MKSALESLSAETQVDASAVERQIINYLNASPGASTSEIVHAIHGTHPGAIRMALEQSYARKLAYPAAVSGKTCWFVVRNVTGSWR